MLFLLPAEFCHFDLRFAGLFSPVFLQSPSDIKWRVPCPVNQTVTCFSKLAWVGHATRHDSLSKTILQDTLGGWATPWSAEEMLDGRRQRVDIPAHARTVHKGLLQKRLEEDLC